MFEILSNILKIRNHWNKSSTVTSPKIDALLILEMKLS